MDENKCVSEFSNVSDNHNWILAYDQIKTNQKQSVFKFKIIISDVKKKRINEIKHKYNDELCLVFQVF